ncbi:uroporphyrinogen decarboxylase [Legionella sp. CNM-4043-24]|uniref:uroporphyrinogen decarboxylase n=1 Tax=Legionella sp. CNM-4043-24 TaxID=3421646 RepID=UPI00403ADD6C
MADVNDSLFLRALRREPVSRTPVWLMRQAGRYLPEYRQTRAQAGDFLSLCKNTELACEVTLQPLRRFQLDAAILFSDILTIPDAMGLGLYFAEGEGPCFRHPLHSIKAIEQLPLPSMADSLSYVMDAVRMIRRNLPADLPLIGFSGSPWTLACYMVEGRSSPDFHRMRTLIDNEPSAAQLLLEKLAKAVTEYLSAQVLAGANALMIFDTWGGLLSTEQYQRFSLAYMHTIVTELKKQYPRIPVILFTKGGGQWLQQMADTGCDALGLDWTCDLGQARQVLNGRVALQGNLAPTILLEEEHRIRQEVEKVLNSYGHGSGHVFNLGHGITPDVLPERVKAMVDAVHELSPAFHLEAT